MKREISLFIAIIIIMASGKSFGAFPVKQVSLNQNSLTVNNQTIISCTEKYKIATGVFRFSNFQTAGVKQDAMNNFLSHNSFVFGKTNISQNVMTGFSWKSQQSKGNGLLTSGLVILGIGLACMLAGALVASKAVGINVLEGGLLFVAGGLVCLPGLIVTICGLAIK